MKFECDLIRDLMPLCADDAASESSKKAVQSHIAVCTECAREWDSIRSELTVTADAPPPESKYADAARRYRNKRAILIFIGFLLMLGLWYLSQWLTAVFAPLPGFPTPEEALYDEIKSRYAQAASGIPDYDIKFQYEWTDDENKQNITYFVLPKGRDTYDFVDIAQVAIAQEAECYGANSGRQGVYDAAKPFIIFGADGYRSHRMPEISHYIVSGMTQDAQVTSVEIKHYGTVQTLTPDETGFFWGIFPFPEDYTPFGYTGGDTNYARAYDADGNLLYELTADDKGLQTFGCSVSPW